MMNDITTFIINIKMISAKFVFWIYYDEWYDYIYNKHKIDYYVFIFLLWFIVYMHKNKVTQIVCIACDLHDEVTFINIIIQLSSYFYKIKSNIIKKYSIQIKSLLYFMHVFL